MAKLKRFHTQLMGTLLGNAYVKGFLDGKIFRGATKNMCVPFLNCYSCPGAMGACPIGAMQAVFNSIRYGFSFYGVGFVMLLGALTGRWICGHLCPFGFFQDLLYKIPLKKSKGHHRLGFLKYVILIVFVFLIPIFFVNEYGIGFPAFCKFICPAGTLGAGIPLVILNPVLRRSIGFLFVLKISILVSISLLAIRYFRFFCHTICPLGAILGLFNPISAYGYAFEKEACVSCNRCQKACGLNLKPYENANSVHCVRCGKCKEACPTKALQTASFKKIKMHRPENSKS